VVEGSLWQGDLVTSGIASITHMVLEGLRAARRRPTTSPM